LTLIGAQDELTSIAQSLFEILHIFVYVFEQIYYLVGVKRRLFFKLSNITRK